MRTLRTWAALMLVGFASACSEPLTPGVTPPGVIDPSLNVTTTSTLEAAITDLIERLFPTGLQTSLGTRWETVKTKYDGGQLAEARQRMFELVRWVEGKKGHMSDPQTGETTTTAATRLVSYMVMYVFEGPSTPVPTYNTGADATFEVVDPAEDDTVTTPAQYAGLNVDPGTFTEPVVVTIIQNPTPYPANCTGPLTTTLCQYPRFYDFDISPKLPFQHPVHIAVCHLDESEPRGPLDHPGGSLHDRLRLAHPLPANSSEWNGNGTQLSGNGNDIEILPRSALSEQGSSGVDCEAVTLARAAAPGGFLAGFASAVRDVFTPRPLYAVDFGPEHDTFAMSPFNLVDPQSQPDRSVAATASSANASSPGTVLAGEGMTLSYTVANSSPRNQGHATATADPSTAVVVLSLDAVVSLDDHVLTPTAMNVPSLPPDAAHTEPVFTVVIPPSTAPGSYYLLVDVSSAGAIAEVSTVNNTAAIPITVVLPSTSAETNDMPWSAAGAWHAPALPGVANSLYPVYVGAAPSDASPGLLPAPSSGARAWWYGSAITGSYIGTQVANDGVGSGGTSTGAHSGSLSSPVFTVPAGHTSSVQFRSWFEIESVDAQAFDLMLVYFQPSQGGAVELARMNPTTDANGAPTQPVTSGGFDLPPVWEQRAVDLTPFAGQTGQLHFYFDTGDHQYNGFRGWVVDDVVVHATPGSPTLVASSGPLMSRSGTTVSLTLGSSSGFAPALKFPTRE